MFLLALSFPVLPPGQARVPQLKTPVGISASVTTAGTGKPFEIGDRLTVHFTAATIDGKSLGSTERRGLTYTFAIGEAWNDPLIEKCAALMREGADVTFTCKAEAAYGNAGVPPFVAPGTDLVLEIRILGVVRAKNPSIAQPSDHNLRR